MVMGEAANGLFFPHYCSEILHQLPIIATLSHCLRRGLVPTVTTHRKKGRDSRLFWRGWIYIYIYYIYTILYIHLHINHSCIYIYIIYIYVNIHSKYKSFKTQSKLKPPPSFWIWPLPGRQPPVQPLVVGVVPLRGPGQPAFFSAPIYFYSAQLRYLLGRKDL